MAQTRDEGNCKPEDTFNASKGWLSRWLNRYRVSVQRQTEKKNVRDSVKMDTFQTFHQDILRLHQKASCAQCATLSTGALEARPCGTRMKYPFRSFTITAALTIRRAINRAGS